MTQQRWRFTLLALAGGAVLAWLAWHSRTDLLHVLHGVSPSWMALSVTAGVALNVIYGLLFDRILSKYSGHQHPTLLVAVYLMSQPGKYLPGKVWQAVMQTMALGRHSNATSVGMANVELSLAAVLSATGLGLACLFVGNATLAAITIAATLAAGWALVSFPSGHALLSMLPRLRTWLRSGADGELPRESGVVFLLVLTTAALALNFAASWWLLVSANTSLSSLQRAHVLASLWLGIAASLLALPIPAGLGIREAAVAGLGTLLVPEIPAGMLISIALLARCWQLLVDVTSLLAGWALWHTVRRAPPR